MDVNFNVLSGLYYILLHGMDVDVDIQLPHMCCLPLCLECHLFPMVDGLNLMPPFLYVFKKVEWVFIGVRGSYPSANFGFLRFMLNQVKCCQILGWSIVVKNNIFVRFSCRGDFDI